MSNPRCLECGRVFDLNDEDDAGEFYYGHDCETPPFAPLNRPPNMRYITDHRGMGGWFCSDCNSNIILFDDDEHFCEATGTSTRLHDCEAP